MLVGILAGLATGALWGLVFVAPRMVSGLTAVDFTAGRFVSYGALSLVLMLLWRKSVWPTLAQAAMALGMSVLGFTGYYLLLVHAIEGAGTAVPSLIIGTIPIWMVMLGKPVGLRWAGLVPGLILTALGLGLMVQATYSVGASEGMASLGAAASQAAPQGTAFWRGVIFAIAAMLCWTAFGVLNAAWLKKHPDISATAWANWLGIATGFGALALWIVTGSAVSTLQANAQIVQAVFLCVFTGVGSAWLATILWNIASQRLPASLCGQLIVSETLFALVYSFIWDAQWPTAVQLIACALFVCGILASIRAHR